MVDALHEAWRVLIPGGLLLDLRPLAINWPVEMVTGIRQQHIGWVNTLDRLADGVASDRALAHAVDAGWFSTPHRVVFDFIYLWHSPDGLRQHAAENWSHYRLAPELLTEAARVHAAAGPGAQLRIRRTMTLGRYERLA